MSEELMINQWLGLLHGLNHTALSLCTWFLIALLTIAPLEKLFTLHKQKLFRKDFLPDVLYFFISGLFPAFVLVVINDLVIFGFQAVLPPESIPCTTARLRLIGWLPPELIRWKLYF